MYESIDEPFQGNKDHRTAALPGDDDFGPIDIMAAQRADELNGNMPFKGGLMQRNDSVESEIDEEEEEEEEEITNDDDMFRSGHVAHVVEKLVQEERTGKKIIGMPNDFGRSSLPAGYIDGGKRDIIDKPMYRFQPSLPRPTQLLTGGGRNGHRHDDVYEVADGFRRRGKQIGGEDSDDDDDETEWKINQYYEGRVRKMSNCLV